MYVGGKERGEGEAGKRKPGNTKEQGNPNAGCRCKMQDARAKAKEKRNGRRWEGSKSNPGM
jgi:hypothetical protein